MGNLKQRGTREIPVSLNVSWYGSKEANHSPRRFRYLPQEVQEEFLSLIILNRFPDYILSFVSIVYKYM